MASVSSTGRRDGSMDSTASKLSLCQLNDALLSHRKSVEAGQQAAAKPYQRSRFSMESVRSAGSALARLCAAPVFMDSVLATRASLPEQQGSRVKAMAFDAACKLAAVLLFDSTVSVWDVETGALKAALIKKGDLVKSDAARSISQSLLFQSTGSVGLGPGSTGGVGGGSGRGHSAGVNGVLLTHDGSKAVTFAKVCIDCIAHKCMVNAGAMNSGFWVQACLQQLVFVL